MFKSDKQKCMVIRAWIDSFVCLRADEWWSESGPLFDCPPEHSTLSGGERRAMLVAWDIWNGCGKITFDDIMHGFDATHTRMLGELLIALATDSAHVDDWCTARRCPHCGRELPGDGGACREQLCESIDALIRGKHAAKPTAPAAAKRSGKQAAAAASASAARAANESEVESDDWHHCYGGCGTKHFDHAETQCCKRCGHYCPGT